MYFGGVVLVEEAVYLVLFPLSSPISTLSILYKLPIGGDSMSNFFPDRAGFTHKGMIRKSARFVVKGSFTNLIGLFDSRQDYFSTKILKYILITICRCVFSGTLHL